MQVHQGHLNQMPPLAGPTALTIGNFDGVHRGHQYLIAQLIEEAKRSGVRSAVLCFDPHPDVIFGTKSFQVLMPLQDKVAALRALGVDVLVVQSFTNDFAQVSAEDFLRQYLFAFFNLSHLWVGYDFRFGHKGEGDFELIQKVGGEKGVTVSQGQSVSLGQQVISSSWIRQLLRVGKVGQAREALGRCYSLRGQVGRGRQLGRQLGVPTANLRDCESLVPGAGVYACRVQWRNRLYEAVVNVGTRPTVSGRGVTIEAHLLNFAGDLYGENLEIHFFEKIRDEKKFENLEQLKEQIQNDIKDLRGMLESSG